MIVYNGATGGLGRYLATPLGALGEPSHALAARLEDQRGLQTELAELDPHGRVTLLHLAARVSVPACEADPVGARHTNVLMAKATVNTVLDWAAHRQADVQVVYVSSGHVYAAPAVHSTVSEASPTSPRSVYAQTKLDAEGALARLCSDRGVPILIARVFGLIAPDQPPNYVLPGLIERARSGRLNDIPGLDHSRDYLDARDVCRALLKLVSSDWRDTPSIVNVCSGAPVSIREVLRTVLHELDPERADALARAATAAPGRPDDVRWLVGDATLLKRMTGEMPQHIPLAVTVADAVALVNDAVRL